MVDTLWRSLDDVDVALVLIDASRGLGGGDRELLERIGERQSCVVVPNKVDLVRPKSKLLPLLEMIQQTWSPAAIVPICALGGAGCDPLLEQLLKLLTDPKYKLPTTLPDGHYQPRKQRQ